MYANGSPKVDVSMEINAPILTLSTLRLLRQPDVLHNHQRAKRRNRRTTKLRAGLRRLLALEAGHLLPEKIAMPRIKRRRPTNPRARRSRRNLLGPSTLTVHLPYLLLTVLPLILTLTLSPHPMGRTKMNVMSLGLSTYARLLSRGAPSP